MYVDHIFKAFLLNDMTLSGSTRKSGKHEKRLCAL